MTRLALKPIAAFDIGQSNTVRVSDDWPGVQSAAIYRWIHLDLNEPSTDLWVNEFLPEIAARALVQSETRPRCERLEDGLILNLRAVNLNPESDPEDMVSLRLWITERTIVSARARKVWAADAIHKSAEVGSAPPTTGVFLAELTSGLTKRIETVSLDLEEQTDELEEAVADGMRSTAGKLGSLRLAVIKMRRFINPQREAITTLAELENWIIAPQELALLRETANRTRRIVEELDATRDRLTALQDHIEADRALATSRNSYVLSVIAAVFLPLGFVTGLFGVNVAGMPGTATPLAFWILTSVSVLGGIALFLIFKFSKWL